MDADDELVDHVEVCFHEQDCMEFVDQQTARFLFNDHRETILPSRKGASQSGRHVKNDRMHFAEIIVLGSRFVMA